jgi:NADPH-dependent ferric siderophore reductase
MTARLAPARTHAPMRRFDVTVTRVRTVTPHLVRITFGGADLADFHDDGPDQRFKLFLPRDGQDRPLVPEGDDWFARWRALPDAVRPTMRTYTVRRYRPEPAEIDVDFVLHGDAGPATAWAARARPGDAAVLLGVRADHAPPAGAAWQLLAGDGSALPAIAAILERTDLPTLAYVEVAGAVDRVELEVPGDSTVRWVYRADGPDALLRAVRGADLPAGSPYAWVAGESAAVQAIRRHLVADRGIAPDAVTFGGYWRLGAPIDPS